MKRLDYRYVDADRVLFERVKLAEQVVVAAETLEDADLAIAANAAPRRISRELYFGCCGERGSIGQQLVAQAAAEYILREGDVTDFVIIGDGVYDDGIDLPAEPTAAQIEAALRQANPILFYVYLGAFQAAIAKAKKTFSARRRGDGDLDLAAIEADMLAKIPSITFVNGNHEAGFHKCVKSFFRNLINKSLASGFRKAEAMATMITRRNASEKTAYAALKAGGVVTPDKMPKFFMPERYFCKVILDDATPANFLGLNLYLDSSLLPSDPEQQKWISKTVSEIRMRYPAAEAKQFHVYWHHAADVTHGKRATNGDERLKYGMSNSDVEGACNHHQQAGKLLYAALNQAARLATEAYKKDNYAVLTAIPGLEFENDGERDAYIKAKVDRFRKNRVVEAAAHEHTGGIRESFGIEDDDLKEYMTQSTIISGAGGSTANKQDFKAASLGLHKTITGYAFFVTDTYEDGSYTVTCHDCTEYVRELDSEGKPTKKPLLVDGKLQFAKGYPRQQFTVSYNELGEPQDFKLSIHPKIVKLQKEWFKLIFDSLEVGGLGLCSMALAAYSKCLKDFSAGARFNRECCLFGKVKTKKRAFIDEDDVDALFNKFQTDPEKITLDNVKAFQKVIEALMRNYIKGGVYTKSYNCLNALRLVLFQVNWIMTTSADAAVATGAGAGIGAAAAGFGAGAAVQAKSFLEALAEAKAIVFNTGQNKLYAKTKFKSKSSSLSADDSDVEEETVSHGRPKNVHRDRRVALPSVDRSTRSSVGNENDNLGNSEFLIRMAKRSALKYLRQVHPEGLSQVLDSPEEYPDTMSAFMLAGLVTKVQDPVYVIKAVLSDAETPVLLKQLLCRELNRFRADYSTYRTLDLFFDGKKNRLKAMFSMDARMRLASAPQLMESLIDGTGITNLDGELQVIARLMRINNLVKSRGDCSYSVSSALSSGWFSCWMTPRLSVSASAAVAGSFFMAFKRQFVDAGSLRTKQAFFQLLSTTTALNQYLDFSAGDGVLAVNRENEGEALLVMLVDFYNALPDSSAALMNLAKYICPASEGVGAEAFMEVAEAADYKMTPEEEALLAKQKAARARMNLKAHPAFVELVNGSSAGGPAGMPEAQRPLVAAI